MLTIEDIMMVKGPDVIVASLNTTVLEVAKMMDEANVGSVILREDDEVKGIFTERDLLRRIVAKGINPADILVGSVKSSPVRSCRLEDDVQFWIDELSKAHMRHVVVIEDGSLVGIIGLRDMITSLLRTQNCG